MKKFFRDFKEFALQGSVLDLAVGVIIGAAFQGLVTSFTDNIISPILGLLTGQNFNDWQFTILNVTFTYGAFLTTLINFLITAFIVFLLVRGINKLRGKTPEGMRDCPYCHTSIPAGATRCPNCTSELTPAAPVSNQ